MPKPVPSEYIVDSTFRTGLSLSLTNVLAGFAVGGLASVVLVRGGGAGRKAVAGFGAGAGLGSAWAKVSGEVEALWK
ncbi:hypothetical protein TeGR_g5796 [Tetraparma gracilis]|jgi:hypothetical protein|uniref:Uncharacterized protein n=1 Tax=Tetraparma gracilis TaxID=2962635 RepID=A0ABQ6MK15_9STRA|nr:hypothetical protein TeGR_g5796 [Tetraparma gracilis]